MPGDPERAIKMAYKEWRNYEPKDSSMHPDEEEFACFVEGTLSIEEAQRVQTHILGCEMCGQKLALLAKMIPEENLDLPVDLLEFAKGLVKDDEGQAILEIIFQLKDGFLELVNTTGAVLVGQELVPAPILRSRQIKDFKDEVLVIKDFDSIRVEIKLENKPQGVFNLTVVAKEKQTQQLVKDLRITLLKDGLELESYNTEIGKVIFENVVLGRYMVEISSIENKLAGILVDIRK